MVSSDKLFPEKHIRTPYFMVQSLAQSVYDPRTVYAISYLTCIVLGPVFLEYVLFVRLAIFR